MGSRLFVLASTHRIATTSTATFNTSHIQAGIVTVTSLPGAGVLRTIISLNSGTAVRKCCLQLDGSNSGSLTALIGTTRAVPSTLMIPTADGRWYFMAAYKPAGTVAVQFYMYDYSTGTETTFNTAGTVANRTAAVASVNVGSDGAASYWDGRIAMVLLGVAVTVGGGVDTMIPGMIKGPRYWHAMLGRTERGDDTVGNASLIDLTQNDSRILDVCHRDWAYTTGTIPSVTATSPPGW